MNNKGFTVVELLASFTLTMVIVVFLFEIVLQLKEVYIIDALTTKIYEKNAVVAVTLNNKLVGATSVDCSGPACKINDIDDFIKIGADNKSIVIGDQTIKYPDNVDKIIPEFNSRDIGALDADKGIIKIKYSIKSGYLDKDMTFNFVRLLSASDE